MFRPGLFSFTWTPPPPVQGQQPVGSSVPTEREVTVPLRVRPTDYTFTNLDLVSPRVRPPLLRPTVIGRRGLTATPRDVDAERFWGRYRKDDSDRHGLRAEASCRRGKAETEEIPSPSRSVWVVREPAAGREGPRDPRRCLGETLTFSVERFYRARWDARVVRVR